MKKALLTIIIFISTIPGFAQYNWTNVNIQGMGMVTGIVSHPTSANLVYVRTDVYGIYKWDEAGNRWDPLNDMWMLSDGAEPNIESVAIDPSDVNNIYIAAGNNAVNGQIWEIN